MKTILIPTDFSNASSNAIDYAVELALLTEAKLILLHVYHIPLVASEIPVIMPSLESMESDSNALLSVIARKLHLRHGYSLSIEYKSVCGFAVEEIEIVAQKNNVDLIVMGMRGAGIIEEKLFGSITISVIHNVKFPVLAIDEHVKFRSLKKIVLATDNKEIKNPKTLDPLKAIAELFKSQIHVLSVVSDSKVIPTLKQAIADIDLDKVLEGFDRSFHVSENKDVIEGINHFVESKNIDMVVVIPRQHSFFTNLFIESNSKRMAFHINVPLLSLRE